MTLQHNRKRLPAGFTLIEILVVLAIIAILISLVSAAVFRVLESQKDTNSQGTVGKVHAGFREHTKSLIEQAKTEDIPAVIANAVGAPNTQRGLYLMAQGDLSGVARNSAEIDRAQRRMRLLWIKLRLRQEFPMTFDEARYSNATFVTPQLAAGIPFVHPNNTVNTVLAPKITYLRALAGPLNAGHNETSALYLLSLKQNRKGTAFKVDEALASTEKRQVFTDGLDEIADAWGNPIIFVRWPTGWPDLNSVAPHNPPLPQEVDPTDPEMLLLANVSAPGPGGSTIQVPWAGTAGGLAFQRLCHAVQLANYVIPVTLSYGRNGMAGLNVPQPTTPPTPANPGPWTMQTDATNNSDDNIFSYRLRLGGRGD